MSGNNYHQLSNSNPTVFPNFLNTYIWADRLTQPKTTFQLLLKHAKNGPMKNSLCFTSEKKGDLKHQHSEKSLDEENFRNIAIGKKDVIHYNFLH